MDSIAFGACDVPCTVRVREFKEVRDLWKAGWIKTDYGTSW